MMELAYMLDLESGFYRFESDFGYYGVSGGIGRRVGLCLIRWEKSRVSSSLIFHPLKYQERKLYYDGAKVKTIN